MKFVMFPSGLALFPTIAKHDECHLVNESGKLEEPISAGSAGLRQETVVLQGRSINLDLNADTIYPDWLERHVHCGLAPQRKTYKMGGGAFFLPFAPIEQCWVRGIGKSVPEYGEVPESVTLKEVIEGFKNEIRYD